jgi:ABC-type bacteriocin/lantibiotic exporter with double-glycine peptidase domain
MFRKILSLLTRKERLQLYGLFVGMVAMALMQVVGIASVTPFLMIVADPGSVERNAYLNWLYTTLDFSDTQNFLIFLGIGLIALITLSNALTMFVTWLQLRFAWLRGYTLSRRLLCHYLAMPYSFFLNRNSAVLGRNVLAEVKEVIAGVLIPTLEVLSKGIVALAIIGLLLAIDPVLALATAGILGGMYGLIFLLVRKKLDTIGKARLATNAQRYQAASEAFGGIKDVKLLGKEREFLGRYARAAKKNAEYTATNDVIGKLPQYLIQTLLYGGMVFIVIFLLAIRGSLTESIPIIGLYAFASHKLLPALQDVFKGSSRVVFGAAALNNLYRELSTENTLRSIDRQALEPLCFTQAVSFEDVTFRYPNTQEAVLDRMRLTIRANTSVAFVGATGSGKTTTVDLLLGLLVPSEGRILVDGVALDHKTLPRWQANLGYVPQQIYLTDNTIAQNIAFGVPESEIDMAAVECAAKIANIHDFITQELPKGYRTRVGERGIRLSGGQRQRIGIARALYHDPSVLVLDEATSALDTITEESIFHALETLRGKKTVVMIAHRLTTVKNCDLIYLLERGRVIAQGSYQELMATSEKFRQMAQGGLEPEEALV